ncbi:universal stress protein [Flindersiella endophytica]
MEEQVLIPPIVVGIDGSPASAPALVWAAETAALRRCPLHVVHAVRVGEFDTDAQSQKLLAWADRRLTRFGTRLLDVTMSVRQGDAAAVLSHAAEEAQLLVLGRRGYGRDPEALLGSTALACTTDSPGPTVVVPPEWRAFRRGVPEGGGGCLVVGVGGSPHSQAPVEFAFSEAAQRQVALTAVHAGPPEQDALLFADALAGWREKYPEVAVTERVELTYPATALIRAAAHADLLVVGAPGHECAGSPLGSSTQTVLRHAACPVAVVPSPKERTS